MFGLLRLAIISILIASGASAAEFGPRRVLLTGAYNWVLPGIISGNGRDCYLSKSLYYPTVSACTLTVSRASIGTSLLPTSPAGYPFQTFANNVLRLVVGAGAIIEEARQNFLSASTAPATQTTGTLANGTYSLWVNGTGSATMSSGTATGCGTGAATTGGPISFTLTGAAGTCIVTVAGVLNAFQLELNPGSVSAPLSFIPCASAPCARAADVPSLPLAACSTPWLYAAGTPEAPATYPVNQIGVSLNDGTNLNRFQAYRVASTGGASIFVATGGVAQTVSGGPAAIWNQNAFGKAAAYIAASGSNLAFDGTNGPGAGALSVPATTQLNVGSRGNGDSQFNGVISRFAYGCGMPQIPSITNLNQYNYLLRRDFGGPANDNRPMWLQEAA